MTRRVAIVLFNLGGPDGPDAVRPFLLNLFNDRAIIGAPQPARWVIAQLISRTREKLAKANYAFMGGRSPLLAESTQQAEALESVLAARGIDAEFKIFLAMRYWRPFTKDAAQAVAAWGADEAVLLPLYPQYSTTTSASSLLEWRKHSALPASTICCYPSGAKFAQVHADAILNAWREGGSPEHPRVLFSAHGLPKVVVDRGDPYQWQVERSAAAVRALLPTEWTYRICYQSRVGPMEWLAPSTLDALDEAGRDGAGVVVSPIAFVSEHVETLVELDIEYAAHAQTVGLPFYLRAPALTAASGFIETLADLVQKALSRPGDMQSEDGARICPARFGLCPQANAVAAN